MAGRLLLGFCACSVTCHSHSGRADSGAGQPLTPPPSHDVPVAGAAGSSSAGGTGLIHRSFTLLDDSSTHTRSTAPLKPTAREMGLIHFSTLPHRLIEWARGPVLFLPLLESLVLSDFLFRQDAGGGSPGAEHCWGLPLHTFLPQAQGILGQIMVRPHQGLGILLT